MRMCHVASSASCWGTRSLLWLRWAGPASIKNGVLLGLAVDAGFEVFLTFDRNIQHQQNVPALGLALVVLAAPNKKLDTIRPLVPEALAVLDAHPQSGTLSMIGSWRV